MEEKKEKSFKELKAEGGLGFAIREEIGRHPEIIFSLLAGAMTLAGGIIKLYIMKTEYTDNLFTEVDGDIYKIPARQMKTANYVTSDEKRL